MQKSKNIIYTEKYIVDIGAHVFPTVKYKLVYERLLKDADISKDDFIEPRRASDEDLLLAHTQKYIDKLKYGTLTPAEVLILELPYSKQLVDASYLCAGGTIMSCEFALTKKVGLHLGGGFHHAFSDHGEGFCVLNDIAVGIRRLKKDGLIKKAAVFDCDLHQGNGTASIFSGSKDVFTFSIHQENNYPYPKQHSSLDIGLEDGTGDEEYLNCLKKALPQILKDFKPDLIVHVAGADPFCDDQLGGLDLTVEGLKQRDEYVLNLAKENNTPCAVVLAGGYAYNEEDTATIHYNTIRTAINLFFN